MPENCPVTPLSQSEVVRNPRITNLNYTCQEYWSLKSRIVDLINANRFKNVRPFSRVGEKRTVQDIFEEGELGKVDPRFADIEIQKTKKGYQIVGSNTLFDSYIEAVMALLP